MVLDDALAGHEMDVPHPDAAAVASLLYGIIETAAEDGENIDIAALAL